MAIKIGIDYDEPMFPWYDYAHDASVAYGLTRAEDPPPTRWDPHSHYGCAIEEWYDALNAEVLKGADGMYARPCKPEAVEAVRQAYRQGYEIHFVTARGSFGDHGENIKRLTKTQLIVENIPHTGLHFAQNKSGIIKALGIDYFLDDRAPHYSEAEDAGAEAYLLDERWNRDFMVPEGKRVYSTAEYIDLIVKRHGTQGGILAQYRPPTLAESAKRAGRGSW